MSSQNDSLLNPETRTTKVQTSRECAHVAPKTKAGGPAAESSNAPPIG